jgi:hypothetical protein
MSVIDALPPPQIRARETTFFFKVRVFAPMFPDNKAMFEPIS